MKIEFFYGDNEYEISRKIAAERARFNLDQIKIFDVMENEPDTIFREILNIDLFATEKLFILKNIFAKKDFPALLLENISRIPDGNSLILVDEKPDKRTKKFKELIAKIDSEEFAKLKDWQLKAWLESEVNSRKILMKNVAQSELISRKLGEVDPQRAIASELDKLSSLNGEVTPARIREFVDENPAINTFEILNFAITAASAPEVKIREQARAEIHSEIAKLKTSGEDPNRFMGLLASQIFAITAAVFAKNEDVASLKIHPFQLNKARDSIQKISSVERTDFAKNLTMKLARTDAKLKLSSADSGWILIENFLANL